jgi:glycosyltransferase involved in cell wall biosynthesis
MPERRLSICYALPGQDLIPGSSRTRHVISVARTLSRSAQVTVVVLRVLGDVGEESFEVSALEADTLTAGGVPPLRRAAGRFVEERCSEFDVVLEGNWPLAGRVTAWCAERGVPAVPVVDHLPPAGWLAPLDAGKEWLALGASGRYLRRAPVIVAGSQELKEAIVDRWRVDPDRITVVRPGVDRAHLHPRDQGEARRQLGMSGDHRVLLAGGILNGDHDLGPVIEAVQRVGDPKLRLHVLGEGEARAGLQRLAGRGKAVTFHGRVSDDLLAAFIAASDLCVAVEHPDAPLGEEPGESAFVLRECLAAGRPVAVGSDRHSHPLVRHLVSGFLLEHDLLSWARFLQRDCPSRNALQIMGVAASATLLEGVDQTAAAYLEAIDRAREAAGEPEAAV